MPAVQVTHPVGGAGVKRQLVAANTACAAAGAWTSAGIISLDGGIWRRLRLVLDLDSQAIGNIVAVVPLFSCSETAPAATDDDWFELCTTDGTTTATTLAVAPPAGSDFTLTPGHLGVTERPIVMLSPATLATTEELRHAWTPLDVTGIRHIQFLYAETGVTGTPSKIGLWYALGC